MSVNPRAVSRPPAYIVGLIAVATLLASCGSTNGSSDGDEELPVVKFGATTTPSSIGTVAALIELEDLDKACGINMEMSYSSPDAADISLLAGKTDIGYFGYNSWAGSQEKQEKLSMLAPLQAEHGVLFVPEDSSANSLEDLKGEKIALLPPVSGQHQDFKLLVAKMGMDFDDDFQLVTGPPPAIEAFLKRGEVAAAILFEPNATNLELAGGYRPILSGNGEWQSLTGDPLYMLGISANSKWLADHETEAVCAVTAVQQATEMLSNDPSVYERLKDVLGAEDEQHIEQLAERLGAIYTSETAEEAEKAVHAQLVEAENLGVIPSAPETVFTPIGK